MNVRFKKEYAETTNGRLSYELVSDKPIDLFNKVTAEIDQFWDVKLLGLIPMRKMEKADGTEYPAIDTFVKLSNK